MTNAIELLTADHDRVRELYEQIQNYEEQREKRRAFREMKQVLDLHAQIEETVFYPVFQDREDLKEIIQEAYDEHQDIRDLLEEIDASLESEDWEDELDDLITCIDSHFEEEETELFPKVEEVMTEDDLQSLGARLQDARKTATEAAA